MGIRAFIKLLSPGRRRDEVIYDRRYLDSIAKLRKEKYSSYKNICGISVAPGEEVEALEGEIDYLYSDCDSEAVFQAGLNQLSAFIGPARQQLQILSFSEPESDGDLEYLEEEIESAELAIAEAEWMVANPEEALAQWRESR